LCLTFSRNGRSRHRSFPCHLAWSEMRCWRLDTRCARTSSGLLRGLLTIAGAGRDARVVLRRGRGKTVCARGATLAAVRGRSASPLEVRNLTPVPPSWAAYRRRSRIAMFGLLGFPAIVVFATALRLTFGVNSQIWFVALALCWCGWWGWAAFRAVRSPCPRCGVPFLANQDPWEHRCGKCGLALYANL
jgi:ribosomal protein S27AE